MSEAPHEVYTRLLLPKKHGYPLYIPGPHNNLPEEYRSEGVRIGDVGVITYDGGFDVLFNICLPADHPLNAGCVPEGFTQVELTPREVIITPDYHPQLCVIGSDLITKEVIDVGGHTNAPNLSVGLGLGYNFNSSAAEGALLVLPEGAHRMDLSNLRKFYDYAYAHAETWYEYVNGQLGRMVSNDSLYLVTGCDKSSTWAMGSYSGGASAGGFSATFSAANIANGDISNVYSWERSGPATMRVGPSDRFVEGYHGNRNQGVFIRGMKIAVREGPFARLKGRIKVTSTTGGMSDSVFRRLQKGSSPSTNRTQISPVAPEHGNELRQNDVVVEPVPPRSKLYHPSDSINKFLLESFPDAQVVITHDDRWCSAIGEHTRLPSDYEIEQAMLTKYTPIVGSGRVFLFPKSSSVDPSKNVTGLEETSQLQRAPSDNATRPSSLVEQSLSRYKGFENLGSISDLEKANTLHRKAVELTRHSQLEPLDRLDMLSDYFKHFDELQRLSDTLVIPGEDVENPSWVANLVRKTVDQGHHISETKPTNVHPLGIFKSRPKNLPNKLRHVSLPDPEEPLGMSATRQPTGPELMPSGSTYARSPLSSVVEPSHNSMGVRVVHPYLMFSHVPPIVWNVSLPCSSITTVDHQCLTPQALSEPATNPRSSALTITSIHLPWSINVFSSPRAGSCVTVSDVLSAIHRTLQLAVTPAEFKMLPSREVKNRINANKGSQELKRIDFLMGENRFLGLSSTQFGRGVLALNVSSDDMVEGLWYRK